MTSSSKLLIEGHSPEHLQSVAEGVVQKKTANSIVLDKEAEARIPKFEQRELTVGRVLGRGGFCVVNEITNISLHGSSHGVKDPSEQKMQDEHHIHNIVQDRSFMEKHCIRSGKDCRYALKRIQEASRKDAQTYINAIVDLAVESRFLAVIRHPNIIKMRAMATDSPYSDSFFVVLDRLYDIMGVRITKWKKREFKGLKKMFDRGGKKEMAFWIERVTVAYDLACAFKYLHDLHILYRDVKPDNIGFDVRGDVKIFDFGLAKEFDPATVNKDGTYQLTGDTGSPRYMAPEVALNKPYNGSCDVYSFCILMWQIFKLETPFEGYSMNMFQKKVVIGGARPKCDPNWPQAISDMLKSGWGVSIKNRPDMEDVCECLREEINRNSDEEVNEIMDISRKSALSLHSGP